MEAVARRRSVKESVIKNFQKLTGKDLYRSQFLIKKKRLQHKCFSVNFANFTKTTSFIEHLQWLLLD